MRTAAVGYLAGVVVDREDAVAVGFAAPDQPVRRGPPERLVGSMESVLRHRGARWWWRGRRRRAVGVQIAALRADVHGTIGNGRAAVVLAAAGVGGFDQHAAVGAVDELQGVALCNRDDSRRGRNRREDGPIGQAVLPDVGTVCRVDRTQSALATGAVDGRVASGD